MFKGKGLLFILTLIVVLGFKPASAMASTLGAERLSGLDRYQTAIEVSKYGWPHSEVAILATGLNFPDALGAAPLAKKFNAPILLNDSDTLTADLKTELDRLGVKKVFIVGGTGVISGKVENELIALGKTVTRFGGSDRYETSVLIAKEVGVKSGVVIASGGGFADALSIAPVAAQKGLPILLMPQDYLPEPTAEFLKDNQSKISTTYVIGGDDVISSSLDTNFYHAERIPGNDTYERNVAILNRFKDDLDFSHTYVATGENFPDALSGTALAPQTSSPVILLGANPASATIGFFKSKESSIKELDILGGLGAVSKEMLSSLGTIEEPSNGLKYQSETDHFIFYAQDKDNSTLPDLSQELETNYSRIVSSLKATIDHKIKVEIYPNLDALHIADGRPNAANWSVGSGVSAELLRMVSPLNSGGAHSYESLKQVIVHEFVHVVERNTNPMLWTTPKWLSEGLAIYEAKQFNKDELTPHPVPSLAFLANNEDTPDWGNQGGYAFSCTIIEYIVKNYGYDSVLQLFKTPDVQKVLGVSSQDFEANWKSYLRETYQKE